VETVTVLSVQDVSVRFGGIVALSSFSLAVGAGERIGVIGPNGAGKTTLLDVLSGLTRPSSGKILFEGVDVTQSGTSQLARSGLSRTFQRARPFGWLSAKDNVVVPLEWKGRRPRVFRDILGIGDRSRKEKSTSAAAMALIERCGLEASAKRSAGALPIGQIRLLELARALVTCPSLILLDEPTSGLEARETERFAEVLTEAQRLTNCSYLLVEHDLAFVLSTADRLVVLNQGEILDDGTPSTVLSNPEVIASYLGTERDIGPQE
jgi:branched-chain amino acid transport system ATP-binding protein